MLEIAFYLVTKDVAQRCGLVGQRYMSQDQRYILDNKDLSRARLTADEYITGLQGIEKITKERAQELIKANGYSMKPRQEEQPTDTEETAQTEENGGGEETISEEGVGSVENVLGDVVNEETNVEQTNEEEE